MLRKICRFVMVMGIVFGCGIVHAEGEVVKNGDFLMGAEGWGGVGVDDGKEVGVVDLGEGKKGMKLVRKAGEAGGGIDQMGTLKRETLYRFVVKGRGTGRAFVRLRPASSGDKDFSGLYQCWSTSSAPMPKGTGSVTSELLFDSGLKADSASVSVFLEGNEKGEFVVEEVSLKEVVKAKEGEKVVLHLGDSITITSYLPFEQRVERVMPELKGVRQINYGVDGETVKELMTSGRYQKVVKENLGHVDVVVIRYGANDIRAGSAEEFKTRLGELCDALGKDYPGVKIVLGTGPCLAGATEVNKKYGPYWQASRDLAGERKLGLVDVYAAFEKAAGAEKLCRGAGDMHPSAEGVKVMGEEEWRVLRDGAFLH